MDVERGRVEEANGVLPHAEDALDLEEGELREEDSPPSSSSLSKGTPPSLSLVLSSLLPFVSLNG
jgi:hypothetical protein